MIPCLIIFSLIMGKVSVPSGVLPVVCHACNLYKETVPTRLEKIIAYCGKVIAELPGLMDTPRISTNIGPAATTGLETRPNVNYCEHNNLRKEIKWIDWPLETAKIASCTILIPDVFAQSIGVR